MRALGPTAVRRRPMLAWIASAVIFVAMICAATDLLPPCAAFVRAPLLALALAWGARLQEEADSPDATSE